MNTYIFYPPPFEKTAKVFKKVHARQQMFRAMQLYNAIRNPNSNFHNLPVAIAWEQHAPALAAYIAAFAKILGDKSIQAEYKARAGKKVVYPAWTKDAKYHGLCRSALREALPYSYGHMWPGKLYKEFKGKTSSDYFPSGRPVTLRIKVKVNVQPTAAPPVAPAPAVVTPATDSVPEDVEVTGTESAYVSIGTLLDSIQHLRESIAGTNDPTN